MKDEQSDAIHEALLPAEPIGDDDQQQSRDCSLDDNKQTQSSHGITRHDQYDPSIPPVLITKNYGNVEVLHQVRTVIFTVSVVSLSMMFYVFYEGPLRPEFLCVWSLGLSTWTEVFLCSRKWI